MEQDPTFCRKLSPSVRAAFEHSQGCADCVRGSSTKQGAQSINMTPAGAPGRACLAKLRLEQAMLGGPDKSCAGMYLLQRANDAYCKIWLMCCRGSRGLTADIRYVPHMRSGGPHSVLAAICKWLVLSGIITDMKAEPRPEFTCWA